MSFANKFEDGFAPDFTLPDLEGNTVSLSTLRGAPVVINFFTGNCVWCRTEMPRLAEIYRRINRVDVRVIGIFAGSRDAEEAAKFVAEYQLDFPVVMDSTHEIVANYRVTRVPSVVIVDQDGKVVRVYEGASEQLSGIVEQTIMAAASRHELPDYSLVGNGCAPD